jgi:hypothetical protein
MKSKSETTQLLLNRKIKVITKYFKLTTWASSKISINYSFDEKLPFNDLDSIENKL